MYEVKEKITLIAATEPPCKSLLAYHSVRNKLHVNVIPPKINAQLTPTVLSFMTGTCTHSFVAIRLNSTWYPGTLTTPAICSN